MNFLQFSDHLIPYEVFLKDLAAKIVRFLKSDKDDPEYISQRKAYKMFRRRNVERWRRTGAVEVFVRPGKVEYRTADLRMLQRTSGGSNDMNGIISVEHNFKHPEKSNHNKQ